MKRAHLVVNLKSGKGFGAKLPELAQKVCDELGVQLRTYSGSTKEQFESQILEAVKEAEKDFSTVIAAGGDGTIRGVAEAAAGRELRFAVVPVGTFNFFARNHRVPEEPEAAFRLALTGDCRPVRLGEINERIFLVNASLGLYAKAIGRREQHTKRYGRNRVIVILSTISSFFKPQRLLKVEMDIDGKVVKGRTPMIFIGNNAMQLRDLAFDVARCMKRDLLAVVMMKPVGKMELLRILARGFTRTIDNEKNIETFCTSSLVIETDKKSHDVALDGEMFHMQSPLKVGALPKVLNMVLPPKETK